MRDEEAPPVGAAESDKQAIEADKQAIEADKQAMQAGRCSDSKECDPSESPEEESSPAVADPVQEEEANAVAAQAEDDTDANRSGSSSRSSSSSRKQVELVMSAAQLLAKLELKGVSEEEVSNSSVESTANSGAAQSSPAERGGESGDDVTSQEQQQYQQHRKRRLDLGHHFLRDIVKIQHDRNQYEKRCQSSKQQNAAGTDAAQQGAIRSSKRFEAHKTPLDKQRQQQHSSEPPQRTPPRDDDFADNEATNRVRGSPSKERYTEPPPANLKITLSKEGREVRELPSSSAADTSSLPPSFEFKANAVSRGQQQGSSRNRNRGRSSNSWQAAAYGEPTSPPSDEMNARRKAAAAAPSIYLEKLPPKDKPFAGENTNSVKWSDMVETSEGEQSPSVGLNAQQLLGGDRDGKKKHRQRKKASSAWQDSYAHHNSHTSAAADDAPNAAAAAAAPRRTVFERLGPRVEEYEGEACSAMQKLRISSGERDHLKADSSAAKDAKQKRSRLELYVPRRGGSSVR